jgi:hypothetical protein
VHAPIEHDAVKNRATFPVRGCMPKPPTPNHRRDPLIGRAKSTASSMKPTMPTSVQMTCWLR